MTATLPAVIAVVEESVGSGRVPGAIVAVQAADEIVHCSAHGVLDAETAHPLQTDTVLWLASLSKVIGAAALLTLVDEGRLELGEPVSTFIPSFAGPGRVRLLRPGSPSPTTSPFGPPPDPPPQFDIVPANRELTVFDLLTHTGGLQSLLTWNPEYVPPAPGQTLAEYVPELGGLVRDFQAGEGWAYSNAASFDVLSRVMEIASGQDLATFLDQRILDPLGMRRTGFGGARRTGAMPVPMPLSANPVLTGDTFRTVSAGLWGDARDYLRFAEMLRRGGVHDGRRLLSAESVEHMTTNRIGDLCPGLNGREPVPAVGFGLSVAVLEDPVAAGETLPAGSFGWDGVGTRRFWVSPSGGWSLFMYAPDVTVQREIEAAVATELA